MSSPKSNKMCLLGIIFILWFGTKLCLFEFHHATTDQTVPISTYVSAFAFRKPSQATCLIVLSIHTKQSQFFPANRGYPTSLITIMVLMMSGDIQLNPGPAAKDVFPCGYCQLGVSWSNSGVACEDCDVWYHRSCADLNLSEYSHLAISSIAWICYKCHSINHSSLPYHSYELDLHNSFGNLSTTTSRNDSVFNVSSPNASFHPVSHSSPLSSTTSHPNVSRSKTNRSHSCRSSRPESEIVPAKKQNWRTLVVNCNSVKGKQAELAHLIDYTDPDMLMLTETKIDPSVSAAEFLPPNYNGSIRKDRSLNGGGVLIATKSCYDVVNVELEEVTAETVWAQVSLQNHKKMFVGSFYRQPDHRVDQLESLDKALSQVSSKIKDNTDCTVLLGGDFNTGDINWDTHSVDPNSDRKAPNEKVLEILDEYDLTQVQREPTREGKVLDLFCTNKPSLVKSMHTLPGISDHNIILADCELKPVINKKPPRKIQSWSKANWSKIREECSKFANDFKESYLSRSPDENYKEFTSFIDKVIDKYVPSRMTSTRTDLPWLDQLIKRMCRKKARLFKKHKRTKKPSDKQKFLDYEKVTKKAIRQAHWQYINNILQESLDKNDTKPFWRYIKARRQDSFGVAPLKHNGTIHSDSQTKSEILNAQFKSVFTPVEDGEIPRLSGTPYPEIKPLQIDVNGIAKLLKNLNVKKASGPDNVSCKILYELADELAPVLCCIFNQSLELGELPQVWTDANVTPLFKKGNRHIASNYRPVSLTCITCKIMEHVLCRHIMQHVEEHGILTDLQHGFRSGRSCETQLLITLQDLLGLRDQNVQTDLAILDFSKAFDTVPHNSLLGKLEHYGINNNIRNWISAFLKTRHQCVVVDGVKSSPVTVDSGVPQGTVLGPLLFLLHINDLPQHVTSTVRMFADDCLLYRAIKSQQDQLELQHDIDSLVTWSKTWGMSFNAQKCNIMRISRSRSPLTKLYTLSGFILEEVSNAKYLGINIAQDLDWSQHVSAISQRGNSTLGFLRRNLKNAPAQLKETAYLALVRSVLEYGASTWDPHKLKDINKLERVQRKAARFVKNDHRYTSSVSEMLNELGWKSLAHRRKELRLALFYKVVHQLVAVPTEDILIPADTRTRAQHSFKYRQLRAKTESYRNSFFPRTILEYSNLPADIAEAPSTETFKSRLSKHHW